MASSSCDTHQAIRSLITATMLTARRSSYDNTPKQPTKRKIEEVTYNNDVEIGEKRPAEPNVEVRQTTQQLSHQETTENSLPLKKRAIVDLLANTTDHKLETQAENQIVTQLSEPNPTQPDEKNKDIKKVFAATMQDMVEEYNKADADHKLNMKYLQSHEDTIRLRHETKLKELEEEERKKKAEYQNLLKNYSESHKKLKTKIDVLDRNLEELTKKHEEKMRNMSERENALQKELDEKTEVFAEQEEKAFLSIQIKKSRLKEKELLENIAYLHKQENNIKHEQDELDEKISIKEQEETELKELIRERGTVLLQTQNKLTRIEAYTAQLREEVTKLDKEQKSLEIRQKEQLHLQEELETKRAVSQKSIEELRRIQNQTIADIKEIEELQRNLNKVIMGIKHSNNWSLPPQRTQNTYTKSEVICVDTDDEDSDNYDCNQTEAVEYESSEIQITEVYSIKDNPLESPTLDTLVN